MNPLDVLGVMVASTTALAFLRRSLINSFRADAADMQQQLEYRLELDFARRDLQYQQQLRLLAERLAQVQGVSMPKVIGTRESLHNDLRDLDDHFRKGGDLDTPPGGPYPFEAVDDEDMEGSYDPAQRTRRHVEVPSSVHPYREAPLMVVPKRETGFARFVASLKAFVRRISWW